MCVKYNHDLGLFSKTNTINSFISEAIAILHMLSKAQCAAAHAQ